MNLHNPTLFTEKLQWLKLYNRKPSYTGFVDKVRCKEIVSRIIGTQYVIPTLKVWNKIEEIDWSSLPESFVIKTTQGGGSNGVILCKDKKKLDIKQTKKLLKRAIKQDVYRNYREWPYKDVERKVFAEQFLTESSSATDLTDYKFYCFNGNPLYCQVIRDRHKKETIDFYDYAWNHMPFVGLNPKCSNGEWPVPKPPKLSEMLSICHSLSEGIPFVRVDLYYVNNSIYFGELTFYPGSGFGTFNPQIWNSILGSKIVLPPKDES